MAMRSNIAKFGYCLGRTVQTLDVHPYRAGIKLSWSLWGPDARPSKLLNEICYRAQLEVSNPCPVDCFAVLSKGIKMPRRFVINIFDSAISDLCFVYASDLISVKSRIMDITSILEDMNTKIFKDVLPGYDSFKFENKKVRENVKTDLY